MNSKKSWNRIYQTDNLISMLYKYYTKTVKRKKKKKTETGYKTYSPLFDLALEL